MHLCSSFPKNANLRAAVRACLSFCCVAAGSLLAACSSASDGGQPTGSAEQRAKDWTAFPATEALPNPALTLGALANLGLSLPAELAPPDAAETMLGATLNVAASIDQGPLANLFCSQPKAAIALDLAPGVFTRRNGYWLAWLALKGYNGAAAFPKLRAAGFTRMETFQDRKTSLLGFVASTPEFTIVSFAGSSGIKDWKNDFTFGLTDDTRHGVPGRFHKGFYEALDHEWEDLANTVARVSDGGKPIFLVGHSLGGSMAVLAAARLARAGTDITGVYSFAGPRVGDATFAADYEARLGSRTWRFENNEDIIPHLAPASQSAREFSRLFPATLQGKFYSMFVDSHYTHVGSLMRFDANGTLSGPFPEDPERERRFWNAIHDRSDGKNILQKAMLNWRVAGDHIPEANFCVHRAPE